jgi:N-methylhydantoinase B
MTATVKAGGQTFDSLTLNVLWQRLIATVDEQATTLVRTAFTPVVAEAEDLATGVFDAHGRMLAQSLTGTPGHILSLATSVARFREAFAGDLAPGDVLLCNDPWVTSGHYNDVIVCTPVFRSAGDAPGAASVQGEPVAFCACICHAIDIGGRGFGAAARDVYEEGLAIPFVKLYRAGEPNADVFRFIRANVRQPDEVLGDLHAQVVANDAGARRLHELLDDLGLDGLEPLATAILDRSEGAMREAISRLPNGDYAYELATDGAEDPADAIVYRLRLTVAGDHLTVDYAGTSPQAAIGINATFNYAMAYTVYPLVCALLPDVPFNAGVFRAITLRAPEASIVNARFPAPVSARHLKNYALATVALGALARVAPERVVAGSPPEWNVSLLGTDDLARSFAAILFPAGGMGARLDAPGISATCFPANVPSTAVEIVESRWPLLIERLALRPGSGGGGRHAGGDGEVLAFRLETTRPARLLCMFDGLVYPTPGLLGGAPGARGEVHRRSGPPVAPKGETLLQPGETIELWLPGGGGMGPANIGPASATP